MPHETKYFEALRRANEARWAALRAEPPRKQTAELAAEMAWVDFLLAAMAACERAGR